MTPVALYSNKLDDNQYFTSSRQTAKTKILPTSYSTISWSVSSIYTIPTVDYFYSNTTIPLSFRYHKKKNQIFPFNLLILTSGMDDAIRWHKEMNLNINSLNLFIWISIYHKIGSSRSFIRINKGNYQRKRIFLQL